MNQHAGALLAFTALLPIGTIVMAIPMAAEYRRLTLAVRKPPRLPMDPTTSLVLPGSRRRRWVTVTSGVGYLLVVVALASSFSASALFYPAPAVAGAAAIALLLLRSHVDSRMAQRLELDDEGFTLGERRSARRVRWVHLTDLGADEDTIRYRVNRALVGGSAWRYWDGSIRNRWGVDNARLFRLFERYRVRAMDRAPHFLTGRPERSG